MMRDTNCIHFDGAMIFSIAVAVAAVKVDSESGPLAGKEFVDMVAAVVQKLQTSDALPKDELVKYLEVSVEYLRRNVESYVLEDSFLDLGDFLSRND